MKKILWAAVLMAFGFGFSAESISIRGVVKDTLDNPVSGAEVKLALAGLSTTSDSDGYFLLEQNTTALNSMVKSNRMVVTKENLQVYSEVPQYGRVDVFDLNGKVLLQKNIHLGVGHNVVDLGLTRFKNSRFVVQTSFEKGRSFLAKEGSFLDTLKISKENFLQKEIVLTNANDSLEVVLNPVPQATITKHGAGSSSQAVAQGDSIVPFSFVYHDADGITVEGIPQGLSVTVDSAANTVWFKGIITADTGAYVYTLTTTGDNINVSRQGTFTVSAKEIVLPPVQLVADGYASVGGVTNGGAGGDTVIVSTYAAFKSAVQDKNPKVVIVKGTVKTTDGDGYGLPIESNKTIQGYDKNATIYGGITITNKKNVIVRNINIQGTYPNPGPSDAIGIEKSTYVWVDHVNIWDAEDGNLDIKNQSNYITVSWCKFWYTDKNHPHRLNALIGSGASNHPEDFNHLKVTYHHNWFSTLVNERMPRVMYGNAHIYNNYYNAPGNLYCIGVGSYASVLIEGNYFKDVNSPHLFMYNVYANMVVRNNEYDNVTGNRDSGALGERFITTEPYAILEMPITLDKVPYEYSIDNAKNIPSIVMKGAGPQF